MRAAFYTLFPVYNTSSETAYHKDLLPERERQREGQRQKERERERERERKIKNQNHRHTSTCNLYIHVCTLFSCLLMAAALSKTEVQ